jgi:hypothetical protein
MAKLKIISMLLCLAIFAHASEKQTTRASALEQTGVDVARAAEPAITPEQFHREALTHPPKIASATQLAKWLKARSVVLIDLRDAVEFNYQHLQGAINIPATEITEAKLKKILPDKSTRIVIYCGDTLFPTRRIALTTFGEPSFSQLGYSRTYTLEDLWQAKACNAAKAVARQENSDNVNVPEQPLPERLSLCGKLLPMTVKTPSSTN